MAGQNSSASRRSGPTWTRARLIRVMKLRFGTAPRGGVDTHAAAAAMGVSARTVRRWLEGAHGRSLAHIPPRRLDQLIGLLLPSAETRLKEAQQARYAARAIGQLHQPQGVKPAWRERRWLEEHRVIVLEIALERQLRIRQVTIRRTDAAKDADFRRRGRIVDQATVPTRFHATLLAHRVLTDLAPWRFHAGPGQVAQGFTQAWLADAPATDLQRAAAEVVADPAAAAAVTHTAADAPSGTENGGDA